MAHNMRRATMMVILAASLLASVAASADIDEARVKAAVAAFLGLPEAQVKWPANSASDNPSWMGPISLTLPDPPTATSADLAKTISIRVHPRDYYVQRITWKAHLPPDNPKCQAPLSLDACQAIAARFAREKLKPWPQDMRLKSRGFGPIGVANPICGIRWEEWDGPARTGTSVHLQVNPCPPGSVYGFSLYLAPPHSVAAVRITREQAVSLACDAFRKQGAENPRVYQNHADLYLSQPFCEQPHWMIALEYDNRQGGFIPQLFIDAVTGAEIEPKY